MKNPIEKAVMTFVSQKGNVAITELSLDTEIYDSNIISSLAILELITMIEERFSIFVEPEELTEDNFFDIRTIVDFIYFKQKGR
ncbi:MAG: acyl carrier protein [Desulfatitalea sp.]|nr:acyl carrier protein [Desulfatitalea sp.]NNJ99235.1 acyl carrier protein [Desulfatitalea sp.]